MCDLILQLSSASEATTAFDQHETHRGACALLAGDLNYRVDLGSHGTQDEFSEVLALINEEKYRELLLHDQLNEERIANRVFVGYNEGTIAFAPTYRMLRGALCGVCTYPSSFKARFLKATGALMCLHSATDTTEPRSPPPL